MKKTKSNEPCIICGESKNGKVFYHHLYTMRAFPEYSGEKWNLISVCDNHHQLFHSSPIYQMVDNHDSVKDWIVDNGWYYSELNGWIHD
jgi:hypothetical protein